MLGSALADGFSDECSNADEGDTCERDDRRPKAGDRDNRRDNKAHAAADQGRPEIRFRQNADTRREPNGQRDAGKSSDHRAGKKTLPSHAVAEYRARKGQEPCKQANQYEKI